jgi:hypothetical protein
MAVALLAVVLPCCAAPRPPVTTAATHAVSPAVESPPLELQSLLSRPADLVLTLHPRALARDPVYGPLLRRASELASAYAGPTNLGTTALAVLARTDDLVVAENDRGKEAAVVLRGVPADVDPTDVVDASGHAVWRPVRGDVRTTLRELDPVDASDAELFVAPGRLWIVAGGPAIARARAALVGESRPREFIGGDDTSLVALSFPGDALPQLHQGALAAVGAGLVRVKVELSPGAAGLIVATLTYVDAAAAARAEGTVLAVTLAFRHRLEEAVEEAERGGGGDHGGRAGAEAPPRQKERPLGSLEWLGAAKVERVGTTVVVRAPIPRPWLQELARADVPAPAP